MHAAYTTPSLADFQCPSTNYPTTMRMPTSNKTMPTRSLGKTLDEVVWFQRQSPLTAVSAVWSNRALNIGQGVWYLTQPIDTCPEERFCSLFVCTAVLRGHGVAALQDGRQQQPFRHIVCCSACITHCCQVSST